MSGISLGPSGLEIQEGMGQASIYGPQIGCATMTADERDDDRCDACGRGGGGAESELVRAWRKLVRADPDDPARAQYERDARAAMERQKELMALRATVPAVAPVSQTPLAGKLRRHELGYKNVLDTLRTALANLESDFAVLLAKRMDRPREAKKLLATLFAAPGTVHVGARAITVRLLPAATDPERVALRAFLAEIGRRRFSLPGDPDRRRLAWALR